MLYTCWRDEESDLLGGHDTYQNHYNKVSDKVDAEKQKYMLSTDAVDQALHDLKNFDEDDVVDGAAWVAPNTEHRDKR